MRVHRPADYAADATATAATAAAQAPAPPPIYEIADLVVTKQASPTVVIQGHTVTYTVKVRNLGPDPTAAVVLTDQPGAGGVIAAAHNPNGHCTITSKIVCGVGNLTSGGEAVVTVQIIPSRLGHFTNRVGGRKR